MESQGIVYIAIGQKYLDMAVKSANSIINTSSLKQEIVILSDCQTKITEGICVENISSHIAEFSYLSPDILSAWLKTQLDILTPFSRTLCLDCDIKAISDISSIWNYSGDYITIARAFNPLVEGICYRDNLEAVETARCLSVLGEYIQYNTGVFLFENSEAINIMFELWREEWEKFKHHENMAFNRLISYGLPVIELPSRYNAFYPNRKDDSILVHCIGGYKKYLD
jgi:hypothetical protein